MRRVIRTADDLAEAIRALRVERGATQDDVAEWIGAHRNYVGQLERGQVATQLTRLFDVLSYLGVDVELVPRSRR